MRFGRRSCVVYLYLAIVILIVLWYFWQPSEVSVSSPMSDIQSQIEGKIQAIENDIQRNQQTLHLIRKVISDIVKNRRMEGSNLDNLVKQLDELEHLASERLRVSNDVEWNNLGQRQKNLLGAGSGASQPRSRVRLSEIMCPRDGWSGTEAGIRMTDLYESLKFDNPDGGAWKQGFDISYNATQWSKEKPLLVFVVPHSHQDPGWRKTYDEYYQSQTRPVLDSMLQQLTQHQDLTFIYAEMAFFSRWWLGLAEDKREQTKSLLKSGRLELVTGGWVMNDEANTHYFAMIDQLMEGHQWLRDNLDYHPNSSWAIDPFGHSSTMTYLVSKLGIQNMIIQRVHYAVKKVLARDRRLEFRWRQHWDTKGRHEVFCQMMPFYSYDIPHTCGPDPATCCQFDFQRLPGTMVNCPWNMPPLEITDANVADRANILLNQYRKKAALFNNGGVLLIPLGDDFRYESSAEWDRQWRNYRRLMDHMNGHPDWHVQIKFGTLSDYFRAVEKRSKEAGTVFPALVGDMFTYSDRDDHYWSGFYTSRPFYKRMDRVLETELRSSEIAFSLAHQHARRSGATSQFPSKTLLDKLVKARRHQALFQHHDAITGTARDSVVVDYGNRLAEGLQLTRQVLASSILFLLTKEKANFPGDKADTFVEAEETREHQDSLPAPKWISFTNMGDVRRLVLFNSLAQPRHQVVTLHIGLPSTIDGIISNCCRIEIRTSGNQLLPVQLEPHFSNGVDVSVQYLVVRTPIELPALGVERITIKVLAGLPDPASVATVTVYNGNPLSHGDDIFRTEKRPPEAFSIVNDFMTLNFAAGNGLLESLTDKASGRTHKVTLSFMTYGARQTREMSGAYLFLPGDSKPLQMTNPLIRVIRGPLVQEVTIFLPNVEHVVRLYNSPGVDSGAIEVGTLVDIRDRDNYELSMRVETDIHNGHSDFFTDVNCFQWLRRRPLSTLPLQANLYPMGCAAFIEGRLGTGPTTARLTLASGQPLGVTAPVVGGLEVWLDRRLMQDDNRGLGQGVSDNKRTEHRFRLVFENLQQSGPSSTDDPRSTASDISALTLGGQSTLWELLYPVLQLPIVPSYDVEGSLLLSSLALVTGFGLPCDYHLVTLRSLEKDINRPVLILHRVRPHCGAPWTDGITCQLTSNGEISLRSIFNDLVVSDAQPITLGGTTPTGPLNTDVDKIRVDPAELEAYLVQFK